MNIVVRLEGRSNLFWTIAAIFLIAGIGLVDLLTGYEIAFSLFYLVPISLVTWFVRKHFGVVVSIVSALVWLMADIASGHSYSHPAIYYWNTTIRFSFFIIVVLLLSALRNTHYHAKELARIDNLTGAVNARYFSELVQMEIDRSQRNRQSFTVAYVDLDNFKSVNDRFGHSLGDEVLRTIVQRAKSQLRRVDVVARLGGDEFALLLPETAQDEAADLYQHAPHN